MSPANGTVDYVAFGSSATNRLTVSPASDSTSAYQTVGAGVSAGTSTVTASVVMSGATRCSATSSVTVTPPGPWWQVQDADITSAGGLQSLIPPSCVLPGCNPVFGLIGGGGYPGVPTYGAGSADFAAGVSLGSVSATGWLVNSLYQGKTYDYTYFNNLIPSTVTINEIDQDSVNNGYFSSNGNTSPRGFYWFHHTGDLIMAGEPSLNTKKAIVLVEGGDLYINGRIGLTKGVGFFMVIVGKDPVTGAGGNIIVDPTVSHPNQPGLEGIFLAEGQFKTGAGNNRLYIRGSVVSYGGIALERNLTDNSVTPAEFIEYAPDLIFTFPREFIRHGIVWREIAP